MPIDTASCAVLVMSAAALTVLLFFKKKINIPLSYLSVPAVMAIVAILSLITGATYLIAWGAVVALAVSGALCILAGKVPQKEMIEQEIEPVAETASQEEKLTELLQNFNHHIKDTFEEEINLSKLLDYINQSMIEFFKADGGAVFLVDEFDDVINVKSAFGEFTPCYKLPEDLPHKPLRVQTNFKYAQFPFGESIFGETVVSGKPCYIPDGTKDERVYHNEPEEFLVPGSYIVLPLSVENAVIGTMAFSRKAGKPQFTQEEFEMSCTAAKFAGIAVNNVYAFQEVIEHEAIKTEINIAENIQKSLQPQKLPDLSNLSFGTFFLPAKGICGDYMDVIPVRKDRLCLAAGDMAGKGIQAANLMLMVRAILHLIANSTKDASTVLDWINKGITGRVDIDHYATLSLLFLDMEEHTLEYASASHPPLLLWKKSTGKIERYAQKSDPLGVERTTSYEKLKLTIEAGDIIIVYTDGVIEALNKDGQQYSIDRLSDLIATNSDVSARDISTKVKQDIQVFCGAENQHDDQSLLVVKVTA